MKRVFFVALIFVVCLMPLMASSTTEIDKPSDTRVFVYANGMNLNPAGIDIHKLTFQDHTGNSAQFGICPSNGNPINLKDGVTFKQKIWEAQVIPVGKSEGDTDSNGKFLAETAEHHIAHAIDAITFEQLKDLGTRNSNGTYTLNIRLLGWADKEEKYCMAVWFYGEPDDINDDTLYLVTADDSSVIYLNSSCQAMFNLSGLENSNQGPREVEIHFSERISFEKVESLKYAFAKSKIANHTDTARIKSVDMSGQNCNCPKLVDAFECFRGSSIEKVMLPEVFGVDGNALELNLESMFYECKSLRILDVSNIRIGQKTNIKGMLISCYAFETLIVDQGFNPRLFGPSDGTEEVTVFSNSISTATISQLEPYLSYKETSCSADLNSTLQMNYYLEFTGSEVPVFSVELSYPDFTSYTGQVTSLLDNTVLDSYRVEDKQQTYKFGLSVAASQMTKYLTVSYKLGRSGQLPYKTQTTFAEFVTNNYKEVYPKLTDAMLVYGEYAQLHFDVDIDKLPTKQSVVFPSPSDLPESSLAYSYNGGNGYPTGGDGFGLEFIGNSIVCYTDMRVRHSFTLDSGISWNDYDIDVVDLTTGLPWEADKVVSKPYGQRIYVEISGFAPANFDKTYTVTITKKGTDDSFAITYSPVSYIVGALEKECPQTLKNLCAAAYQFHIEAKEVFNEQ